MLRRLKAILAASDLFATTSATATCGSPSERARCRQLLSLQCWLVPAPVLALAVPLAARSDREQRFTIGSHVTAVRAVELQGIQGQGA